MADAVLGEAVSPSNSSGGLFLRRSRIVVLAAVLAVTMFAVEAPSAAFAAKTHHRTEAQRIVRYARSHIGARFRLGTEGPRYFDCSGLVYRVYRQAGLLKRIGGKRTTAAGYYHWFKKRGRVSRHNPKVGDIVLWKKKGRIVHSGLYVGHGRVISALINPWGVKKTRINSLHTKFFAYLHVNLRR